MPSNVKHQFVSGKADDADGTLIRPSNWNDEHVGAVEIMDRDLAQSEVVSSTSEESIYSHSIPANQLGATGGFRLTLSGDMLENVAGTLAIRIKLGATTIFTQSGIDHTNSATRYGWELVIICMNTSTSAQKWSARYISSIGYVLGDSNLAVQGISLPGTSAEDTTGALTVDVTIQWTVNSASLSFRKEIALLEEIPAA